MCGVTTSDVGARRGSYGYRLGEDSRCLSPRQSEALLKKNSDSAVELDTQRSLET